MPLELLVDDELEVVDEDVDDELEEEDEEVEVVLLDEVEVVDELDDVEVELEEVDDELEEVDDELDEPLVDPPPPAEVPVEEVPPAPPPWRLVPAAQEAPTRTAKAVRWRIQRAMVPRTDRIERCRVAAAGWEAKGFPPADLIDAARACCGILVPGEGQARS